MPETESNLVKHARRELELIDEEPETIEGYLKVVQAFADMGHSGGSAAIAAPVLYDLFRYQPLSPITNDPDEWFYHGPETWGDPNGEGIWQNKRSSSLFSTDGGKTYYSVEDAHLPDGSKPTYISSGKK